VLFVIGALGASAVAILALIRSGCPLWQSRRQISSAVVVGRTPRGSFAFAFELGTGVVTYLPSCAPHVLALLLLTLPLPLWALPVAAAGFGAGRSAGFLARMLVGARDEFEANFQRGLLVLARAAPVVVVTILLAGALR
jgi:hypothetical protein